MRLNGHNINFYKCSWFLKREPLSTDAKNTAERLQRLRWLSEGSLHYHINGKNRDTITPDGDAQEKALYQEFLNSL